MIYLQITYLIRRLSVIYFNIDKFVRFIIAPSQILLEVEGIDIEKPITHKGSTPLILASKMVFNGIVEKLLKSGAQVNAVDASGRTALHWAAAVSNLHAMELLLHHGSNKDAETAKKETPLFLAAREGKLEAVKMLVCHNAQRNLADSMEETPIDVARDHCHHDIEEVGHHGELISFGGGTVFINIIDRRDLLIWANIPVDNNNNNTYIF